MIPISLQLKNFLSYGPELQTIDFGPHRLICLSGKNGHGKSALLDAITWAIWGQARKTTGTAKADAHLLRLGQTFMMVAIDFQANGTLYRIKREYAQTYGKPYASLDFGYTDPETKTFHPLTDKTMRGTQSIIEKTIGLNYETFINSAFLRQGQSNEFSQKSPKERKKILGAILGLQRFETLRKAAHDKYKEAIISCQHAIKNKEQIQQELTQKPEIINKQKEVISTIKELKNNYKQLQSTYELLEKEEKRYTQLNHKYDLLLLQTKQKDKEREEKEQNLIENFTTWRAVNRKRRACTDKKALQEKQETVKKNIDQHQKNLQSKLTLQADYLKQKEQLQKITNNHQANAAKEQQELLLALQQINHQQQQKEDEQIKYSKHIKETQKEFQELTGTIEKIKKEQQQATITASALKLFEQQFEKRKNYFQQWTAQANMWQQELKQINQKQQLTQKTEKPCCPLCEQLLSASRKRFLQTKFNHGFVHAQHKVNRFKRILPALKELLLTQHEKFASMRKQIEDKKVQTIRYNELLKQQEKYKNSIKEFTDAQEEARKAIISLKNKFVQCEKVQKKQKEKVAQALENNSDYQKISKILKTIEEKQKKLAYSEIKHKEDIKALETIETQLQAYHELEQELAKQDDRKKNISQLCKSLKVIKQEKQVLKTKQEKIKEDLKPFAQIEEKRKNVKQDLTQNQKEQANLLEQKGRLDQQLKKFAQQEETLKTYNKEQKNIQKEAGDYLAIAQALSKDGIQALLIEDALPEIEQEANMLLAQLTDNQAHVIIDSLRDLKKGGSKETLDIKISDPMGIRPYELYSGGEAFRIDFALRIAISKLLARRAGTSLQTLIIDEGFGSQDEEGLSRMMEAMYKIQNNFQKVIIVSHLNTMKDQFPVHFLIQKGTNGSYVNVLEQG